MNRSLRPRLIGAGIGLLAGLLLILVGWRILLILIGFALAGYLIGVWFESRRALVERMKGAVRRLFNP